MEGDMPKELLNITIQLEPTGEDPHGNPIFKQGMSTNISDPIMVARVLASMVQLALQQVPTKQAASRIVMPNGPLPPMPRFGN